MDTSDVTILDDRFAHTIKTLRDTTVGAPTRINEILELSVLIEALVLYDKPVIRVHDAMSTTYLDDDPILKPFIEAGILAVERYANPAITKLLSGADLDDDGNQFRFHVHITVGNAIEAARRNARYVASALALPAESERLLRLMIHETTTDIERGNPESGVGELSLYVTTLPILRAMGTIAASTDPLLKSYVAWADATKRELRVLADWGKPIPLMLPPIAAIVFDSARELDSVGRIALDLRDALEEYRTKLREYSASIRRDDNSLRDSLDAAYRLQAGITALTAPRTSRSITTLVNFPELATVGSAWLGGASSGLPAVVRTLLGKPLEQILAWLKRRDALFVASLDERFYQIHGFAGSIDRLVGNFAASDYDTAARWLSEMQRWKAE